MKNLSDYRNKFYRLLESQLGHVKPLLLETELKPEQETELKNFISTYINNNTCDKIYTDLKQFQKAVEEGKVSMTPEEKTKLDEELVEFKNKVIDQGRFLKPTACGVAKNKMNESFDKEIKDKPEKSLNLICWFSQNIEKTTLKSCTDKKPQQGQDNKLDDGGKNTQPIVNKDKDGQNLGSVDDQKEKQTLIDYHNSGQLSGGLFIKRVVSRNSRWAYWKSLPPVSEYPDKAHGKVYFADGTWESFLQDIGWWKQGKWRPQSNPTKPSQTISVYEIFKNNKSKL